MANVLEYSELGRQPFAAVWKWQEQYRKAMLEGTALGRLLLVEHTPTISLGRAERGGNLLLDRPELARQGFEIAETNRGGKVTYHGPGQLVAYPIVNLKNFGPGVKNFVRGLEETMLNLLKHFGLSASRRPEYPGAWIDGRKIGSVGIHVRKQVSIHGLALNVCPNMEHFGVITPCGIPEVQMTSMAKEGSPVTFSDVTGPFLDEFSEVFRCELRQTTDELPKEGADHANV